MHPLTIVAVKFTDAKKINVEVTTYNKIVKVVTLNYLNACTGCDKNLKGALGEIWD